MRRLLHRHPAGHFELSAVLRDSRSQLGPTPFETLIGRPASRNTGAGIDVTDYFKVRDFAVGRALEYNFTTLRISRAFVSLLSRPESDTKMISLAWVGDCEIRMHAARLTSVVGQPLFILDMFDHDAQLFIDSRACYTLAEGAAAFDEFLFMAEPTVGGTH